MILFNKKNSESGVSLVQVMVSLGIMAVAQLAFMRMSENQSKMTKTTEVKFEAIEVINNIRSVLSDKDACKATFGVIAGSPDTGTVPANLYAAGNITEIKNANGDVLYTANLDTSLAPLIAGSKIKIKSFALNSSKAPANNIPDDGEGRTHLEITLDRTDQIYGSKEIEKKVLLAVRLDGPNIVDCSTAATGDSLEMIAEYVCKTLGGEWLLGGRSGAGDCYDLKPNGKSVFSDSSYAGPPINNLGADIYGNTSIFGKFTVNGVSELIGNVDITGNALLDGNLTVQAGHTIELLSDRRLKHNVRELKDVLKKLKKMRGVSYNWNINDKEDIGFIAQEVYKYFPELVGKTDDGFYAVKYMQFSAVLLQAINELAEEADQKNIKIKKLESNQILLEKRINDLELKFEEMKGSN